MELIRHARRRSRSHARKHAERRRDAVPRHDQDATCKPSVYECAAREWQRERSHGGVKATPLPAARSAATAAPAPAVSASSAAPAPLSAPLAASFPPRGL